MVWEDCVVDVHSVKYSQHALESMFRKCGTVRNVIHWKGHGEKEHVFIEYRYPDAAESARTMGLDSSDVQVIKLSNNEMLKKKFRELERAPIIRRSTSFPSERNSSLNVGMNAKDNNISTKPPVLAHITEARCGTFGPEGARTHERNNVLPTPRLTTSMDISKVMPADPNSTSGRKSVTVDKPESLGDRSISNSNYASVGGNKIHNIAPSNSPSNGGSGTASTNTLDKLSKVIEVPHAGETIRLDLEKQLEPNPAGIISMLTNVKAEQKLWMIIAAHYNGNRNLEAARKVLEAGINMATQGGMESDTKPFWHLLSRVNSELKVRNAPDSTAVLSSATASICLDGSPGQTTRASLPESRDNIDNVSSSKKGELHVLGTRNHTTGGGLSRTSELNVRDRVQMIPSSHARDSAAFLPQREHPRTTGARNDNSQLCQEASVTQTSLPYSSAPPHSPRAELTVSRGRQTAMMEDLLSARAEKRRAEDELRDERSVRRKLEKHLRAAEDALARSKRMEDAALDQVKKEIEARRKAEELLAVVKADKDKNEGTSRQPANPSIHDTAALLRIASLIHSVSSSQPTIPWQFGLGISPANAQASSSRVGEDRPTSG